MRRWTWILLALAVPTFCPAAEPEPIRMPYSKFLDRLKGGWAGQMIGVSFGSVYEFRALGEPIQGPLRIWEPSFVENSLQQDDIYVEMTFLQVIERDGLAPTPTQAGIAFRDSKYRLWHANHAARVNLRAGIMPPESGSPRFNPHSDDIDFQIEADLFGLIAPGLPNCGRELAERFGRIMNSGDGLYGGLFTTAMYCQAYLEDEATPEAIRRVIDAGLGSIPSESGYAKAIRDVLAWHAEHPRDWIVTWRELENRWGGDDLCPEGIDQPFNIDAKINGAYVVIGLLYGAGDLGQTMDISTRCGQDADCNPASAAGILATILGYSRIPDRFKSAIPSLTGKKFEYTDYDFPALVAASERVAISLIEREGGKVLERDGERWIEWTPEAPRPPKELEQLKGTSRADLAKWLAEFTVREKQVESKR